MLPAGGRRCSRHATELLGDLATGDPILSHPPIGLEIHQRPKRIGPEDSIDLAGVEAERVEAALQVGDIIAADHGSAVVEHAITEAEAGSNQGSPGVGSNDPVGGKTALTLEPLHCGKCSGLEAAASIGGRAEAEGRQPVLDVADRLPLITSAVEPHRRMVAQPSR